MRFNISTSLSINCIAILPGCVQYKLKGEREKENGGLRQRQREGGSRQRERERRGGREKH